ncbi:MAG: Gfo/Idh/MocA family oxidoreductase [Chitinophagaceae bacterium]|nr:Gfo/Idh/MocA family oxidoreductase [Chitinophagaceae bacterium]
MQAGKKPNLPRRNFIRNSSLAAAGFFIVPRNVLGRGFTAPSDKLNIAGIGAGGKAEVNLPYAWNKGAENIVALCDVDDRMAVNARKRWPNAPYYRDYRQMLDKEHKNIDAVIITSPDHMHAVQAMACMQLGKHVYVEKPLTHDIYEARMLTEAARKYKVVTQMGNQGSSGDDTRNIETWIQDGVIGDVHTVHVWTNRPTWPQGIPTPTGKFEAPKEVDWDLWLGTAPFREFNPTYIPAIWRGWVDFGTGSLGDMGCHFIDVPFRALKLGYPTAVECSVTRTYTGFFQEVFYNDSYPLSSKIHIQFPQRDKMVPVEMVWYDGGLTPKRPAELLPDERLGEGDGGILFEGTKGKLMAGLFGRKPTLLPTKRMSEMTLPVAKQPFVPGGSEGHQKQWTDACKKGFGTYTSSGFDSSGPLTETVLMGNLAVRSFFHKQGQDFPGRKLLLWDGPNMKITNFEPANRFVKREYRKGWSELKA